MEDRKGGRPTAIARDAFLTHQQKSLPFVLRKGNIPFWKKRGDKNIRGRKGEKSSPFYSFD